jgi:hypothetical protein
MSVAPAARPISTTSRVKVEKEALVSNGRRLVRVFGDSGLIGKYAPGSPALVAFSGAPNALKLPNGDIKLLSFGDDSAHSAGRPRDSRRTLLGRSGIANGGNVETVYRHNPDCRQWQ